ncbi:ExeM/NucH family extracellular endonuclease [Microvirga sp. STR05]|uniref:ExeM/NucH family extracellular endonuclease n=1 Tax=Hymenobacter duratus TaxID=2771356 RepID=A0ABR8JP24_9BACT|nr:ExeM/NucH family extracellular endonuclease [Hymenobacter duratus]MBD2716289.1 ExeM/NucH family extracellular endonuclease [Hymenobacter duratus]MBR7951205.1 ExeM/NucH family extracellular endonuclease [Microvirga sp. STR05]
MASKSAALCTSLLTLSILPHTTPARAQAAPDAPAVPFTHIGAIQGSGATATPGTYTIEAVVTGVYPGLSPAGFYVQEVASASDGNPATSDALYVVQPDAKVNIGDNVRITGTVLESAAGPSFTQAVLTDPKVEVLWPKNQLPDFVMLPAGQYSSADLEHFEGMRVQFPVPLTVADVYSLKRRGELILTTGGTLYQPTQFIDPNDNPATGTTSTGTSNVAAINAYQAANLERSVVLDDGSAASDPSPVPFLDPQLRTVRVGNTIPKLRGIMGYAYNKWRIQPLPGSDAPSFDVKRPPVPTFGRLDLKIASFNVLNYFNGDGAGGGYPTPRGAKTAEDFARQRSKIMAGLVRMNPDIIGLSEMENDGNGDNSALQDLVNGLNQLLGTGTYALINDGGTAKQPNNTDVIRCAILYKPAAVTPLGPALLDMTPGVFERPPLGQLFITRRSARPDTLALVVNHFKSKSSGSGPNADLNDGQGGSNQRRREQARELVQFINQKVKPAGARHVVCIGDYNANYEEDPIDILRAAGLVTVTPPTSASYVFKGLTGSLDHCIVTPNMVGFIDVHKWNINSGEPPFLQYDAAGAATDVASPFRSSDHDPVLIGINFSGLAPSNAASARLYMYPNPEGGARAFSLPELPANVGPVSLEVNLPQGAPMLRLQGSGPLLQSQLNRYTSHLAPGIYVLRIKGRGLDKTQRVMKQ